jgi:UDP-N-acetylglucosamine--N-acetylmuramyl-(pentapeptide) pyrophosphoryl-undecaprenol N-acetylglucosamine transferase
LKKIIFTGGGSAGHVTPNIAIMEVFLKEGWEIHYIGTKDGIEKRLIEKIKGVKYHEINAGKLRRYKSIENLKDPFRVIHGVGQSIAIIKRIKPDVIFSKGGFVSVPVVMGAWINRVPAIIHECDFTPGLANKIAIPFAKKVCVTFPDTLKHLKGNKGICTGTPIRKELLLGNKENGYKLCGFQLEQLGNVNKPIITMVGGSLGAKSINECLRRTINKLTVNFNVIHICGKGNLDEGLSGVEGYKQFEYLSEELPDILAVSDIIISRAGANSIFEFLALKKPNLLIPLPLSASRGDQILNAQYFEKCGYSKVLKQEEMDEKTLMRDIYDLYDNRRIYINNMKANDKIDSVNEIVKAIKSI